MTLKKIIYLIKKHHPQSPEDVRRLGISCRYFDSGAFRDVYKIGKSLIIKFPLIEEPAPCNITHSRREIKGFKILKKKLPQHAPKIYYANTKTGIVVMKKYRRGRTYSVNNPNYIKLENAFKSIKWPAADLGGNNFGFDKKRLVILDLGLR